MLLTPVRRPLLLLLSKMAPKQTTLFKHITGVPPPPKQQASLDALWGKKPAGTSHAFVPRLLSFRSQIGGDETAS